METEFSGLLGVAERTPGLYFSYDVNITLRWRNFDVILDFYFYFYFFCQVELCRWTSLLPKIGILLVTLGSLNRDGLIQWVGVTSGLLWDWVQDSVIIILMPWNHCGGIMYLYESFHFCWFIVDYYIVLSTVSYLHSLFGSLIIILLSFLGVATKKIWYLWLYKIIRLSSNRLPHCLLLSHFPRLVGDPVSIERFKQFFEYPAITQTCMTILRIMIVIWHVLRPV